jgi:hypothetical protein
MVTAPLRTMLLLVGSAFLLAYAPRSQALDPAYLTEWPSAEQVLADHQGKDRQDTLAHQMAALHHLDRSIEDMAGTRRWHGLTPDENRLRGEYYAAAERIRDEVNSTLSNELPSGFNGPFAKPPLRKWYALQWKYERDPQVRAQTLSRYLSAQLLTELGAKQSASDDRAGKSYLVPLVALAASVLLILLLRGRRRSAAARKAATTQEPTPDPNPDIAAAAEEVVDSLRPYIVAALDGRERLPFSAFSDPFVLGFLLGYCDTALSTVSGTKEPLQDGNMRVFLQMGSIDRFRELFGGKRPDDRFPDPDSNEAGVHVELGRIFATTVLAAFATTTELGRGDLPPEATQAEAAALPLPINPPATRLHPAGPNAEMGQRLLMAVFTARLAKAVAKSA